MRHAPTRRASLAAAAAIAGCSVLPERPYQERRQWPLETLRPTTLANPPTGPVLLIRAMRAGPGLDSRGLRTILPDGAEHFDYWEEWAVPPPQGVGACLRRWLAASGIFAAVVQTGSELPPQFELETELLTFAADRSRGVARAGMSLVLLRKTRAGSIIPILQRSLTAEAPLAGTDAPAIAAALRAALASLLDQAEVAVRKGTG